MSDPWTEWWEQTQLRFALLTVPAVQVQILALAVALLAALAMERFLDRTRGGWMGSSHLRAVIWAAKFPLLALVYGYVVLAIFSVTGRASYLLGRLVTVFWYIAGYMVLAEVVMLVMPPGQARRIVRRVLLPLLAVVSVLHILGLLEPLRQWLSQWTLTLGTSTIDGASIVLAIGAMLLFWLVARLGHDLLLDALLPRTQTDPLLSRSAATFVQFAIIVAGFWVALSLLGLELSNLTLVVSALTVGIGFGLQDVIKNLVGGLILLSERYVRPNQPFLISGHSGIVEHIGLRSTLLRSADGTRVIIPNADLVVEKVSDLSSQRRVEIRIGVSREADPRRVEELLLELAMAHPHVVSDPAPTVVFQGFGQSTHDFVLYCFVAERPQLEPTASALRYALVETFCQHQIEVPGPQIGVSLRQDAQTRQLPGGREAGAGVGDVSRDTRAGSTDADPPPAAPR